MANRQGSSDKRLNGWERRELRQRFLRANPLCERCNARGLTVVAAEVHHRVQLAAGGDHSWPNLEGLCVECHRDASRAERGLKAKGCGPDGVPFAGWD